MHGCANINHDLSSVQLSCLLSFLLKGPQSPQQLICYLQNDLNLPRLGKNTTFTFWMISANIIVIVWACDGLQRSCFHALPPSFSIFGVVSRWVESVVERLKVGFQRPWPGVTWSSWTAPPVFGEPRTDVALCKALNKLYESSVLATWPKKRSRLAWMSGSS